MGVGDWGKGLGPGGVGVEGGVWGVLRIVMKSERKHLRHPNAPNEKTSFPSWNPHLHGQIISLCGGRVVFFYFFVFLSLRDGSCE